MLFFRSSDYTKRKKRRNETWIKETLSEFYKSLSIITDIDQLNSNFKAKVKSVLDVDDIFILLYHEDVNRYVLTDEQAEKDSPGPVFFLPTDKLVFWLNVNKTFLVVREHPDIISFLSEREQHIIEHNHINFIFPFIVMNKVRGMVLLKNQNDEKIRKEEMELMSSLFDHAGIAFENAFLAKQQRERTKKMYRSDRLATLGQLAAGAAHEIRNPLAIIRSTIQYLKDKISDKEDMEMVNDLIKEVDRINDIILGMLSFSKSQEVKFKKINITELIEQIIKLSNTTARKNGVNIKYENHSESVFVEADENLLMQAFLNILINAIQSVHDGNGEIKIVSSSAASQMGTVQEHLVEITDNGCGIEKDYLERIFDPFFTTKNEGTGLGLSVTYGVINKHNGEIEIQSKINQGTSVKIKLPVRQKKAVS
jgi:two-component system, NtrC family, sensor kinase